MASEEAPPPKKPTRLAIGVEGGFDGGVEPVEYQEETALVILPEFVAIPLPNPALPPQVSVGTVPGGVWPRRLQLHHFVVIVVWE